MTQTLPEAETISLLLNRLNTNSLEGNDTGHALLDDDCHMLLREAALHQQTHWAAHMTPNLAPYSLLGQRIAGLHQGNLLSAEMYPYLQQAETSALEWVKTHFHQPFARFTHGGTYSNLEALWQARDTKSVSNNIVYGSKASHYSVKKACDILGLEYQALDTDNEDRLRADALLTACQQKEPLAVVLNLGSSAAGSIDPLLDCLNIVSDYESWIHIDAAWGGAVVMLPENKPLYGVLAKADSISFDPHKSLFLPRPCSIVMSRHQKQLLQGDVNYLEKTPEKQLAGSYGAELFMPLWLNLRLLGQKWFYQMTRQRLAQARQFHIQLSELTDWPIVNSETGVICFEAPNKDHLLPLVQQGILSQAKINKRSVYRAVFASYQTQATSLIKAIRPYL